MADSKRSKGTRETLIFLLIMIVLLYIMLQVVLYMDGKSIFTILKLIQKNSATKLYSTDSNGKKINRMSKISRKLSQLQESTAFLINASSTESMSMKSEFQNLSTTTSRPLTCNECFSFKFHLLIENKDICKSDGDPIEILILISSAPQNFLARKTIRKTWLTHTNQNSGKIRYAFLIGKSKKDLEISFENNLTKDIILGNFYDTYSNLTFKTLMGFHWTLHYCKNAKFVMKTDDDMYVNIPGLTKTVNQNDRALQTAVGGHCRLIGHPIRDKNSKWYVSPQSYPQKTFPGFCSGTGYITSLNVVSKIANISKNIPFFHLEDVYVSLCINYLGYRLHPMSGFIGNKQFNPCKIESFVTLHHISLKRMRDIWNTSCENATTTL